MLSFINEAVGFIPFSKLDGLGGDETPGLGMFFALQSYPAPDTESCAVKSSPHLKAVSHYYYY